MKALFFAIILANLVVFLWEYRTGAFAEAESVEAEGQEKIFLVGEEKKPLPGERIDGGQK